MTTVPLNNEPLALEADPQSVQLARRWVSKVLQQLGREDLVDSAKLGVSELVTNAILHAEPPISVRVRGTRAHPRVEVRDHSSHAPAINAGMADDENLLSTIGRGLGIVALYSGLWGSDVTRDGKTVWFEPSADLHENSVPGNVVQLAQFVHVRRTPKKPPEPLVTVRLLNMPVQLFAQTRGRYYELTRELRLLALSHGSEYPVACDISDLFLRVEEQREHSVGIERLDEAIASGVHQVDLEYQVPAEAPATMERMLVLLEHADEFCRDQRLLALAASEQQTALQRWYLSEFARQGRGEQPRPWTGGLTVEG